MKTQTKVAIAAFVLFVAGVSYVSSIESKNAYLHINCPACGTHSVLKCGMDDEGRTLGHCLDCDADLTINGYAPD